MVVLPNVELGFGAIANASWTPPRRRRFPVVDGAARLVRFVDRQPNSLNRLAGQSQFQRIHRIQTESVR
jgi:hypothetical protein